MPYINAEQVRTIRNALKKEFPTVKFSVRKEHSSSVYITILEANVDLVYAEGNGHEHTRYSVNPYWFETHSYTDAQKALFKTILQTVQAAHPKYVVTEDSDYGSIPNYYLNLGVNLKGV